MSAKGARRPQSSYGRRDSSAKGERQGTAATAATAPTATEKRRPESRAKNHRTAQKIERKNIDTEYKINKQTQEQAAKLTRIQTEGERRRSAFKEGRQQDGDAPRKGSPSHVGDENLLEAAADDELGGSMPERMLRLTVGTSNRSRSRSPTASGGASPLHRSFEDLGSTSPVLIRAGSDRWSQHGSTSPGRGVGQNGGGGGRAELSNAKLAMMKKKLEPLPSKKRIRGANPSQEDGEP